MKYLSYMAVILLAVCIAAPNLLAETPKTSNVPVSWELEFTINDPQAIQMPMAGESQPQTFWFIRYSVTNRTGEEQIFVPDFTLFCDSGDVVHAQKGIAPSVFNAIKEVYNDPYLKDSTGMTGKLLQGEDNAKDGVAIFKDFDREAGVIDVFIGGLSGDTEEIAMPSPVKITELDRKGKKVEVEKSKIVLSRTLHLQYKISADPASGQRNKKTLVSKKWVMR